MLSVYTFLSSAKCEAGTCKNGGKCTDDNGAVICFCSEGYTGLYCEGECIMNVEHNGGECIMEGI